MSQEPRIKVKTAGIKIEDIHESLRKKRFGCKKDADHVQCILYINGLKTRVRTKMSHGENEIGDDLILKMSRQVKLSKPRKNLHFTAIIT